MKKHLPISYMLIVFIGVIAFGNILNNEFIFDDISTIKENKIISSWSNLPVLFSLDYFKTSNIGGTTLSGESTYRPIVTLSYFLDYSIWGLNSFGFHLSNLLYHLITLVLFFLTFRLLTKSDTQALLASVLYAVHPIVAEAVNCTSFREDILCTLFFYAAVYIHLRRTTIVSGILLFICSSCAYFSKEMAVTLMPTLLIFDFMISRHRLKERSSNYFILFAATVLYFLIRFFVMKNPSDLPIKLPAQSMLLKYALISQILLSYIRLCFIPLGLTLDYMPEISSKYFYIPLIIFTALIVSVLLKSFYAMQTKERKLSIVALLLFFFSLLPVANIVPLKNLMAERYLYLPCGFFVFFFIQWIFAGINLRRIKIVGYVGLITVFSVIIIQRNYEWTNGYRLWSSTLKRVPKSFHAHNNLASWYDTHGHYRKAEFHYARAISIRPYDSIPFFNMGNTLKSQGKLKESIQFYTKAIERDPAVTEPYVNMGLAYAQMGDSKIAQDLFLKAIQVNYADSSAHNNLGVALSMNGDLDRAIKEHKIALKLDRSNDNAYFNLAMCYFDMKEYKTAIPIFERLLRLNQYYTDGWYYLGMCWERLNLPHKAKIPYTNVLRIEPQHKNALEGIKRLP